MNTNDGTLSFATAIDTSGFKRGAAQLQGIIDNTGTQLSGQLGNAIDLTGALESSLKKLGAAVGIGFSVKQAFDFAATVRDVRAEIQSLEISFETLLGSKSKADALFTSIREFAVNTPMQLKDLASAAQMMLSFNISEDKIMPYLKALGDVSMGDTQKFQGLALAFSQMSSAGKVMQQDLMQMVGQGFNPLMEIAEKTGKTFAEVKEEQEAGRITVEMVQQAFIDATSAGGKFYGMLEKQSKGIAGAMSNLQGAIDDMFNELGESSEGIITGVYTTATTIVKNWKDIAEAIGVAVAAYGVYKAAVMTSSAIDSAVGAARYTAEAEELAKVIALKEADANADVQSAVASGELTAAKGQAIIAARAEAEAVVESLKSKAALAEMDLKAAVTAEASAKKTYLASVQNLEAAEAQLVAAKQSGDMFAISAAQANVDAAAQERDAAAKNLNAASTDIKTKKQIADAAATTAETAATQLNTAAETGNTAATNFLAAAKTRLIAIVAKLRAAMLAHPYALVAAAVAVLVYGIYKLCTAQTDAEKAQKRLNDAMQKAEVSAEAEVVQFKYLFDQLKKAKEGTEEYQVAKTNLNNQFGSYFTNIDLENAKIKDLEAVYDDLTAAVRRSAKARAMNDFIKDEGKNYTEDMGKYFTQAREAVVKAYGEQYAKEHEDDIRRVISGEAEASQKFLMGLTKKKDHGVVDVTAHSMFTRAMEQGRKRTEIWNASVAEAEYKFGDYSKPEEEKKDAKSYAQAYNDAKDEWDRAKAKLAEMQKSKDKFTEEEFKSAKDTEKAAKEKYEKLGGKTSAKTTSGKTTEQLSAEADASSEKLTTVERRQARDRKRMTEDMEYDIWQARIDAGEYGMQAYIQQRELDFSKEQTQLQRQMEDAIDAEVARQREIWDKKEELTEKEAKAKGKTYTRKAFDSDNLSGMEFKPGTVFDDEKIGDVDMANIYAISQQYAQLEKLMLAEQEKARQDETKRQQQALNEYLAQWGEYLQKRQALIDIANAKLNNPDSNLTEGERKSIAAQLTKDLADLDTEATKTTNAIGKLFGDMTGKTITELRNLASEGQKALDMLTSGEEFDEKFAGTLGITKEMWEALKNDKDELEKIRKAIKDIKGEADKLESPTAKITKGFKDVFAAGDDKEKLKKALEELKQGLGEVFGAVSVLTNALSQLGDAFGSGAMSDIADGMSTAMDAVNGAMQGAQAGAAFGPWGAAAGAAIGLVGSLGSSLAKLHDAKHEKKIQAIQEQIEALDKAYADLGDEVEKAYSKDASNLINQQNKLLEQQKVLIQQQINEEKSKKKTDNDRIKEWESQIDEINDAIADNKEKAIDAIFGEDLKSAIENFADAYADAWAQGEDRAKSAKDTVRNMMKQMVEASIKAAIQSSGTMENIRAKLQEFYADNVLSQWEQDYVYKMATDLQKELDRQFGWAESLLNDNTYEQSATAGGFQAMSEDTGSELNGRFTAMQITMEQTLSLTEGIKIDTGIISDNVSYLRAGMDEMQNIALLQLGQLEAINRNTKELGQMSDTLDRIDRNIQSL